MRYEGKSEQDAVEQAAESLGQPAGALRYRVIRDEKSFWGGRVVEIEVEEPGGARAAVPEPEVEPARAPSPAPTTAGPEPAEVTDAQSVALVEATLTEL